MQLTNKQQHPAKSYLITLAVLLITLATIPANAEENPAGTDKEIIVYKTPTCGCCKKWVKHLEQNGFKVISNDMQHLDHIKRQAGVQPGLASCHTAIIGGYTIEGHVPAADIIRLLAEKPDITGLAVPGMPMGSPGMEGPRKDPYQVLGFDREGNTKVFSKH